MMLMLNVPATIGLMVLAQPIVALLLERGKFTPADTAATAAALMFYAPGLLGYSAVKIASPTFYSLRDSRTPVIVSVLSVLANLRSIWCSSESSVTAASRSGPRWRPCSTPWCFSGCCGGGSAASRGGGWRSPAQDRHRARSSWAGGLVPVRNG